MWKTRLVVFTRVTDPKLGASGLQRGFSVRGSRNGIHIRRIMESGPELDHVLDEFCPSVGTSWTFKRRGER
jgi:hypothetical protein